MKTTYIRSLILIVFSALCATLAGADSASYAQILQEREKVLSQILEEQESRRASGHADEEALFSAQVSLYSFRRDAAATTVDKAKHQVMIVAIYEKRLAMIRAMAKMGGVANVEVLRATDRTLQAKQILEELRMREKSG
jgi:hypothetical protein